MSPALLNVLYAVFTVFVIVGAVWAIGRLMRTL